MPVSLWPKIFVGAVAFLAGCCCSVRGPLFTITVVPCAHAGDPATAIPPLSPVDSAVEPALVEPLLRVPEAELAPGQKGVSS